jgi:N-acetylated-alpha-linked acidic dipeptidase
VYNCWSADLERLNWFPLVGTLAAPVTISRKSWCTDVGMDVRGKNSNCKIWTKLAGIGLGKLYQEHGAIGCIILSDPKEGFAALKDVYPYFGTPPLPAIKGSVTTRPFILLILLTPGALCHQRCKRILIAGKDATNLPKSGYPY